MGWHDSKVLKTSPTSPVLKQLELDEADDNCVVKQKALKWWRVLTPAVLDGCHKQLFPRPVLLNRPKNPELLCSSVPYEGVPCVSQPHAESCHAATKIHDEPLVFSYLSPLRQPEVGWIGVDGFGPGFKVQSQYCSGGMNLAKRIVAFLWTSWTFEAGAADYLGSPAAWILSDIKDSDMIFF